MKMFPVETVGTSKVLEVTVSCKAVSVLPLCQAYRKQSCLINPNYPFNSSPPRWEQHRTNPWDLCFPHSRICVRSSAICRMTWGWVLFFPLMAHPAAPSWKQEPGLAFQAVAVLVAVATRSASGGLDGHRCFGSSRGSLAFSHPSPEAVGEGTRQFLLGKQQCFPHQPKCSALPGMSQHCPGKWKLREKEFDLEHRTRSLCSGLSFGVFFVCLGFFVGFYFSCIWDRLERLCPGSQCSPPSTKHKGSTVCARYLNPRLSRKLTILSVLKLPFTNDCVTLYGESLLKNCAFWLWTFDFGPAEAGNRQCPAEEGFGF